MSGLRGSNISEQDFASDGVVMNVMEVEANTFGDALPLTCAPVPHPGTVPWTRHQTRHRNAPPAARRGSHTGPVAPLPSMP